MTNKILHNKRYVSTIIAKDKTPTWFYDYKPRLSFLGITLRKEGFYSRYSLSFSEHTPLEEIEEEYIVEDNVAYVKYKTVVTFIGDERDISFRFNTFQEALDKQVELVELVGKDTIINLEK